MYRWRNAKLKGNLLLCTNISRNYKKFHKNLLRMSVRNLVPGVSCFADSRAHGGGLAEFLGASGRTRDLDAASKPRYTLGERKGCLWGRVSIRTKGLRKTPW